MGYMFLILGGVLLVLLVLWNKIKAFFPSSVSSTVTTAIGKASDVATDAVTATAFQTLAVAAWANNDLAFLTKLSECQKMQAAWGGITPTPTPTTNAITPTVEQLAAEIETLKAAKSAGG
jgi:hypothetical protein